MIKEIKGRRSKPKKKVRRSPGNVKKVARNSKREYMLITRKLRKYIFELREKNLLTRDTIIDLRKKIKNRYFKSKTQLKEYLKDQGLENKKWRTYSIEEN